ncbi:MAG: coproporphyrinogen III oxidase, partial [Chlamydiae bacterium]|nr:coproporphyrinogen III oxidase [Chlamydiota bacterium]
MREALISFLKDLQETICTHFEALEPTHRFVSTPWSYQKGTGGGTMRVLKGSTFEKAAVNFSAIEGNSFPMQDGSGPFFATGVSLITHMHNPHAPTA